MIQYDAIIIGFGKGGKALTAELAQRGWKVALVERCHYGQQAEAYKATIARKNGMTAASREAMFAKLSSHPNVTIYTGIASFVSSNVVKVALPDKVIQLQGKEIFINTGSTSIIPDIDGLKESKNVYTNTSLIGLDHPPRRLIIVGGGYIGLEFASMYTGFGSKVTILEGGKNLIPQEDRDIANTVKATLEKRGIEIHLNVRTQSVCDTADGVTLTYSDATDGTPYFVEGDAILVTVGRKPMIEGLNLQAAGIDVDNNGAIVVNDHLHTTAPHIWAMGDVKGGLQFTYISFDDYRIIRDEMFGNKERTTEDRKPVPYSVFIDPPLSRIGLTEEEAIRRGHQIKVVRLPATAILRARTLQQTEGVLKAIINAHSGKIMGCALFCVDSPEVINTVAMAMKTGQHYSFLRDFIFTHPSMSEGLNDLFIVG